MRPPPTVIACALAALPVQAADLLVVPVLEPPQSEFKHGGWDFDLLPRPFQKNPKMEMSIRCRVTPFGTSYLAASPEYPIYYVLHDAGRKELGDSVAGEAAPPHLENILIRALSTNGYLPASETSPRPELVLVFYWGSSYAMDLESQLMFPELHYHQRMERAKLIGDSVVRKDYIGPGGITDQALFHQEQNSLFFAVVSAYDYASVAHDKPDLVWRAHLTVNAQGVSMSEALPALVLTAGTTFGRDTKGAHYVTRRAVRGKVELAPLVILPDDVADTRPKK